MSVTSKLGDHLPLYRLESIFERQQVHIARSTMCAWMRCAGELVAPLVELMKRRGARLAGDPHRRHAVPIQSPGPRTVPQGAHLVLPGRCGKSLHRVRLHAQPQARRSGTLAGGLFAATLQADAYGGYDGCIRAAERYGSRLLGPCAAEVLRCAGLAMAGVPPRCWR